MQGIPAAFYRTLAYLFEVAKGNTAYAPVSLSDLEQGAPSADWSQPLWGIMDSTSAAPADADTATKVFQTSPFWCYLYSHEQQRAKKTPPKTSEQMIEMHK